MSTDRELGNERLRIIAERECCCLRAKLSALEGACKPFAEDFDWIDSGPHEVPDSASVASDEYSRPITFRDIRCLRALLHPTVPVEREELGSVACGHSPVSLPRHSQAGSATPSRVGQNDIPYVTAALSWYDSGPAGADVQQAWRRIMDACGYTGAREDGSQASSASDGVETPVAWRVKDYADGWFVTSDAALSAECAADGKAVQPLYLSAQPHPEVSGLVDGVKQVHSDLQMLAIACEKNDPRAEIGIRVSDALAVIQDRIAPLLAAFQSHKGERT